MPSNSSIANAKTALRSSREDRHSVRPRVNTHSTCSAYSLCLEQQRLYSTRRVSSIQHTRPSVLLIARCCCQAPLRKFMTVPHHRNVVGRCGRNDRYVDNLWYDPTESDTHFGDLQYCRAYTRGVSPLAPTHASPIGHRNLASLPPHRIAPLLTPNAAHQPVPMVWPRD